MTRSERRARKHWGQDRQPPAFGAGLDGLPELSAALERFLLLLRASADKLNETNGPTPAQAEALARWDVPTAAMIRRATQDMDRSAERLASIMGLTAPNIDR